jgi:hypothetical protein
MQHARKKIDTLFDMEWTQSQTRNKTPNQESVMIRAKGQTCKDIESVLSSA